MAFRPLPCCLLRVRLRGGRCRHARLPHPAGRGAQEEGDAVEGGGGEAGGRVGRGAVGAAPPEDWAPCSATDGRTYFWHRLSGRSRWTLPAGASRGKEEEDEEGTLMTSLTILSSFALFDWPSDIFMGGSMVPCIWQSIVRRCLCLRSTLRRFLGDDSRICRIQLFLWFHS